MHANAVHIAIHGERDCFDGALCRLLAELPLSWCISRIDHDQIEVTAPEKNDIEAVVRPILAGIDFDLANLN